jgi:hypothetical protein
MVVRKKKATKKMEDLGDRKLTSAQTRKVKGGAGGGGTAKVVKGWIDI